ncbi:hypothetical protein N203_06895 [Helicobacter pylori UM084]|nr:hypothetical protein N203_06895 [Helicobacter pylori UM084]
MPLKSKIKKKGLETDFNSVQTTLLKPRGFI